MDIDDPDPDEERSAQIVFGWICIGLVFCAGFLAGYFMRAMG
jgi:hypothetical protein